MTNRNIAIFGVAWFAIIILTALDYIWARLAGFSVVHGWPFLSISSRVWISISAAVALSALSYVPRYRAAMAVLRCREIAVAILFLVSVNYWGQAVSVGSYLGVSLDRPTIDDALVRFDSAIGFDWLAAFRWVSGHPVLATIFDHAYFSALQQLVALSFLLAITRRIDDIAELMALVVASLTLVLLISIPFPASSAFLHYGISGPTTDGTVMDFVSLRSGTMKTINPMEVQGLVSMPSFHIMMAIFLMYGARNIRFIFPVAIALNIVMIASTITVGGHYLADVMGGFVCAAVAIWGVRKAVRYLSRKSAPDLSVPMQLT